MNRENSKSYVAFISSMLIFGTLGIFRRYITLSSGMLAFFRGVLGSIFLLIFVYAKGNRLQRITRKNALLLTAAGAIMGLNWMLLFEAYNYTTVAIATMCYYMQPTIVILLSPLVFREKLTLKKLLCALAAILGMIFVSGVLNGSEFHMQDLRGILFGLSAAVLYSVVVILNKKIVIEDDFEKTIIELVSAAIVMIPYLLLTEDMSGAAVNLLTVVMVLIVGIVHTGLAYTLYFGSMRKLKAQSIAAMSYIDPIFAMLLSALLLHEKMGLFGIVGAVLIIGSAFIGEKGE